MKLWQQWLEQYGYRENTYHQLYEKTALTLHHLAERTLVPYERQIISLVLKYADVSKAFPDVVLHDEESAAYFAEQFRDEMPFSQMMTVLIRYHGIVGEAIRGEVSPVKWLRVNHEWHEAIIADCGSRERYFALFPRPRLWREVSDIILTVFAPHVVHRAQREIAALVEQLDRFGPTPPLFANETRTWRMFRVRDVEVPCTIQYSDIVCQLLETETERQLFLQHIMAEINESDALVTFQPLMVELIGHSTVKEVKKRVIRQLLQQKKTIHGALTVIERRPRLYEVRAQFTAEAEALFQLCRNSQSPLYYKAILLIAELFGLTADGFDRLSNEATYLAQMDKSDDKQRMLSFVAPGVVVDVGAGSGVLMAQLAELAHVTTVIGLDASEQVIKHLTKRKEDEQQQKWHVVQGNALQMDASLPQQVETIVYSSVLHELYSYIPPAEGATRLDTVWTVLRSAIQSLKQGGRLIIRDGVMSEADGTLSFRFKQEADRHFLTAYLQQFTLRPIAMSERDGVITMPVNDAMEFLYTYTWGEEAFPFEVQEQFGWTTVNALVDWATSNGLTLLHREQYVLPGYEEHLRDKIELLDGQWPNSTMLVVFAKQ